MTLKQAKLIKFLPESKTLSEAGEKAGYTKAARSIYRKHTKVHIAEALKCEPSSIIAHYEALYRECMTDSDKATAKSILDSMARINAMFTDKTKQEVSISGADAMVIGRLNRVKSVI